MSVPKKCQSIRSSPLDNQKEQLYECLVLLYRSDGNVMRKLYLTILFGCPNEYESIYTS